MPASNVDTLIPWTTVTILSAAAGGPSQLFPLQDFNAHLVPGGTAFTKFLLTLANLDTQGSVSLAFDSAEDASYPDPYWQSAEGSTVIGPGQGVSVPVSAQDLRTLFGAHAIATGGSLSQGSSSAKFRLIGQRS